MGLAIGLDITEQIELEEELLKITFYDPLTGLPNRLLFLEKLKSLIPLASRRKEKLGVVILDISHFEEINANYGTEKGDEILKEVASRLKKNS